MLNVPIDSAWNLIFATNAAVAAKGSFKEICEEFRVERILWRFTGLSVTYKTGVELDDWIYCTLYIYNLGLRAI
jgi:hypothetical protein